MEEKKSVGIGYKVTAVILIVVIAIGLWGFSGSIVWRVRSMSVSTDMTPEQAVQALAGAKTVTLEGDWDNMNQKPMIEADGVFSGKLIEDGGLFNKKSVYEVNDKQVFYYEYSDEEKISENAVGPAFVFCESDGTVMGYAEETLAEQENGEKEYLYIFYDAEKNRKDYYLKGCDYLSSNWGLEADWQIFDYDGNLLVNGDYEMKSGHVYIITLEKNDNGLVDIQDVLFIHKDIMDYFADCYD